MALRPIVLSGPSGSGKSTLLNLLFKEFPNSFGFSVSHTTRKPRPGEEDGKHYHFTTIEEMEKEIKKGNFIEHAKFSGNMYGTSKMAVQDVLKSNRACLLDIDEQGVKSIKLTDINPLYVFIGPPSLKVLRERLSSRGTETAESIEKRMQTAQSAIEYSKEEGAYDIVIINDALEAALAQLKDFLIKNIPSLTEASNLDQDEVKLSKSLNGQSLHVPGDNGDHSISEISLSPMKLKSSIEDDTPAVVVIDAMIMDDAPVVTSESLNKGGKLVLTDRSSAVVNMQDDLADSAIFCGRNGAKCVLL